MELENKIGAEQKLNGDDEDLMLSASTLQALQDFYSQKQSEENGAQPTISEDWKLSQFWYDKHTSEQLAKEVTELGNSYIKNGAEKFSVAFISCPTLYQHLVKFSNLDRNKFNLKLFEYDSRFEVYGTDFIFYDYNQPLNFSNSAEMKQSFDLIIADPPYLSQECFIKTSISIKHLAKPDAKFIVCSGAVMAELIGKCLHNTKQVKFEPRHENNLGNEFRCYTNYETFYLN